MPLWSVEQWIPHYVVVKIKKKIPQKAVSASVFCAENVRIWSVFRKDDLYETLKGFDGVSVRKAAQSLICRLPADFML